MGQSPEFVGHRPDTPTHSGLTVRCAKLGAGWAGVTFELGARRSGRHEVGDGIDDECRSTHDRSRTQARSGQVRDHVVPRPVPSTVTLPAAFSSVSTNRIVLSDTPGTARRMSAIVNWAGACNST